MAGMEDIKKIAINFTAAFIVAAIFASVAPGAANKVMAFVGDKLGFEEPSIGSFEVNVDKNDNTQFVVKYSILSNNYGDIEKIIVSRSYSKSLDAKMSDRFTLECSRKEDEANKCNILTLDGNNAPNDYLDKGKGEIYGNTPIKTQLEKKEDGSIYNINVSGVHRFTIEVYLKNSDNADSRDIQLLIYDDDYVQMFKGGLSGCVERGIEIDSDIIFPCDVDKEKRRSLISWGNSAIEVRDAFNNANIKNTECTYKSSFSNPYTLSDGCTPEDVDSVWLEYLKIRTLKLHVGSYKDNYDCTKWAPGWREVTDDYKPAFKICQVKRQVVMTLNKLGWNDLRETKGWEAGV